MEQQIEQVPVDDLVPHPENPRVGDLPSIIQSIQTNGWYGTLVAQKSTGYVLAGNHRLKAAHALQMSTVPVCWVDVDDTTARRILTVDNRVSDIADYDTDSLAKLLSEVMRETGDLAGTGYSDDDLDDLIALLDETAPEPVTTSPSTGGTAGTGDSGQTGVVAAPTFDEQLDTYRDRTSRYMNLAFPIEEYDEIMGRLADLRTSMSVESNAEVVLALVRDASSRS